MPKPDIWFVEETAVRYAAAQVAYAKAGGRGSELLAGRRLWEKYAQAVTANWRARNPHRAILLTTSKGQPYATAEALRSDYQQYSRIRVWDGMPFSGDHPMGRTRPTFPAAYYARAFHDLLEHVDGGLGFDFLSELKAAQRQRRHYPADLQPIVWTDDVAIACYREHFGQWPTIQYPVVLKPEWPRLARYIKSREAQIHQYCVEEGAYGN